MKIAISLLLVMIVFSSCKNTEGHSFHWKPYTPQEVMDSIAHKKPVVIDFSAEWCPNCHELDREVFSKPEIQAKLSQVTALRMDVSNQDDPQVQQIIQQYQIDGVPTVIFLDKHGKEIDNSRVIGFVTPEEFIRSLALFNLLK